MTEHSRHEIAKRLIQMLGEQENSNTLLHLQADQLAASGQLQPALRLLWSAIEIAKQQNDDYLLGAGRFHMALAYFVAAGPDEWDRAAELCEKAAHYFEQKKCPREQGVALLARGNIYEALCDDKHDRWTQGFHAYMVAYTVLRDDSEQFGEQARQAYAQLGKKFTEIGWAAEQEAKARETTAAGSSAAEAPQPHKTENQSSQSQPDAHNGAGKEKNSPTDEQSTQAKNTGDEASTESLLASLGYTITLPVLADKSDRKPALQPEEYLWANIHSWRALVIHEIDGILSSYAPDIHANVFVHRGSIHVTVLILGFFTATEMVTKYQDLFDKSSSIDAQVKGILEAATHQTLAREFTLLVANAPLQIDSKGVNLYVPSPTPPAADQTPPKQPPPPTVGLTARPGTDSGLAYWKFPAIVGLGLAGTVMFGLAGVQLFNFFTDNPAAGGAFVAGLIVGGALFGVAIGALWKAGQLVYQLAPGQEAIVMEGRRVWAFADVGRHFVFPFREQVAAILSKEEGEYIDFLEDLAPVHDQFIHGRVKVKYHIQDPCAFWVKVLCSCERARFLRIARPLTLKQVAAELDAHAQAIVKRTLIGMVAEANQADAPPPNSSLDELLLENLRKEGAAEGIKFDSAMLRVLVHQTGFHA